MQACDRETGSNCMKPYNKLDSAHREIDEFVLTLLTISLLLSLSLLHLRFVMTLYTNVTF